MKVTVEQCLARNYPVVIGVERTSGGGERYAAWLLDMPGCIAQGPTRPDARARLDAIKPAFFNSLIERGVEIAEPTKMPAILPGPVAFYHSITGGGVRLDSSELGKPSVEASPAKMRMLQTA